MRYSDEATENCSEEDDLLFLLQEKHKQTLKRLQEAYREEEFDEKE